MVAKSLDNIVGNLWQQRQESSGSSVGNQVRFFYILKRCIVYTRALHNAALNSADLGLALMTKKF